MNVSESSLFNVESKSSENTLIHQAAGHNLRNSSSQYAAVKCGSTRAHGFKSEDLINADGCHMNDIRADPSISENVAAHFQTNVLQKRQLKLNFRW